MITKSPSLHKAVHLEFRLIKVHIFLVLSSTFRDNTKNHSRGFGYARNSRKTRDTLLLTILKIFITDYNNIFLFY